MKILTSGERASRKGPEKWFTGTVWLDEVITAGAPATFKATRVSFAPGARTAWHTHPMGAGVARAVRGGISPTEG